MKTGIELIAEERARQMQREGWTPDHDDGHYGKEMAEAAVAYLMFYGEQRGNAQVPAHISDMILARHWPWGRTWWKPKDELRNLVRAGALIAAEIDRLERLTQGTQKT
jgi:hypothetical protein